MSYSGIKSDIYFFVSETFDDISPESERVLCSNESSVKHINHSIQSSTDLNYTDCNQHKSQGLAQKITVESRKNETNDTENEIAFKGPSHMETTTLWKVSK